jgi:hypothetical protein
LGQKVKTEEERLQIVKIRIKMPRLALGCCDVVTGATFINNGSSSKIYE